MLNGTPHINIEAMEYLSTSPSIVGYLTEPTGMFDGNEIEVTTRKTESLEDSKNYFDNCGKKIIMYSSLYLPSEQFSTVYDPSTGEAKKLDEPATSEEMWLLRYTEI